MPSRRSKELRRRPGLGRALLLTAASTVVPGVAHMYRRRRIAGFLLLTFFATVVGFVAVAALQTRRDVLQLALDPAWLLGIIVGTALVALAWAASVVWSYRTVRPARMSAVARTVATMTVTALCAVVCAPLLLAANFAQAQRDLVTDLFPDHTISNAPGETDPWQPGQRVNVLLLGGDADPERKGVRTDVMMLASVNPDTGRTVLLSIPRNLQNAPMPFPGLRQRFPHGFPNFLFGVWRYGVQHPRMVPGNGHPGATLLTETIEGITGLPVDHYALVDLDGFKTLVDALGGVRMDVQEPIRYGERGQFVVRPGERMLTGREALWYARSRYRTSDYDRMQRQRCLMGAMVRQADPVTVLRNFRDLADATKRTVSTNVPRDILPHLVDLAPKVKEAQITNIQFVPPLIDTGNPDFAKIRRIAARAVDPPSPSPDDTARAGGSEQQEGSAPARSPARMPPPAAQPDERGPGAQRPDAQRPGGRGPPGQDADRPGGGAQDRQRGGGAQGQGGGAQGDAAQGGEQRGTSQPSGDGGQGGSPVSLEAACPSL